ncbi:hypothetical protein C8N41_102801 [Winogradskyella sediminis]|nr:hypothetical protein C8N41_102801 [Winogradskyella sediminis]
MERYNFTNPLFLLKIEPMIRRFFILLCFALFTTCDDGDILTVDLEFEGVLAQCDNFEDYHLIYDTNSDPNEALILIFPKSTTNDALFTSPTTVGSPVELTINASTVRFIYRTYNRTITASDICAILPPYDLAILEDYEAESGTIQVTSTYEDDDNDGVPTAFEGVSGLPSDDGIYYDSLDTDDDGIPDYIDIDDDGDNVLTKNEIDDSDDDDDPTTNPLDTDGDGTPDYIDKDDDGDLILTRYEDTNGENGPGDDRVSVNGVLVAHYLNDEESIAYIPDPNEDYIAFTNEFTRTVETHFIITDIDLEILRSTIIDMGTRTTVLSSDDFLD